MLCRRNPLIIILLFFIYPLITGCPYESKVAIADKSEALFDPDLEGTWFSRKDRNGSKSIISQIERNEYKIRHYRESNNKIEITEFNAFITKLGNEYFVNVYEPSVHYTSGGFLIFKIDKMSPKSIKITEVDRYKAPLNIDSQEKLQMFLKENINNKSVFSESEIWDKEG